MKRALISVYNKEGIVSFARFLTLNNYEIISSGGTLRELQVNGVSSSYIETITRSPEMMGGRVKTLHPRVHGGILMRRGIDDAEASRNGIVPIDMVVVNLYPFEKVIVDPNHTFHDAIENIDVGGPCMARAAAKNHAHVTVVTEPDDYIEVRKQIEKHGEVGPVARKRFAQKAFAMTALYDREISMYLSTD